MSSNTETFTFDRPETIDDATYSRIVFIRPLELAVQPIIDHNMELIGTVRRLRPWYRGEHDVRTSEADRRVPKGERGRQIAAVRKLVREARANGKRMTILQACRKAWRKAKGGYPSAMALYQYCHDHAKEF